MSRLKDTVIEGTSLNFAEFSESTIENCRITDSRLRSCGFRQVQLRRTTLQDVSLSDADVHMTSFRGVDLSGCAIDGLRLSRDLSELQGAKISAPQAVDIAGIIGIQIL